MDMQICLRTKNSKALVIFLLGSTPNTSYYVSKGPSDQKNYARIRSFEILRFRVSWALDKFPFGGFFLGMTVLQTSPAPWYPLFIKIDAMLGCSTASPPLSWDSWPYLHLIETYDTLCFLEISKGPKLSQESKEKILEPKNWEAWILPSCIHTVFASHWINYLPSGNL